jgi:hypothetical protein
MRKAAKEISPKEVTMLTYLTVVDSTWITTSMVTLVMSPKSHTKEKSITTMITNRPTTTNHINKLINTRHRQVCLTYLILDACYILITALVLHSNKILSAHLLLDAHC